MTRIKALAAAIDDLAEFEIDVAQYYSDSSLEPQVVIDAVLDGKINSLRLFCQTLGWSDLVAALGELVPLRGNAFPSLLTIQAFVIPEARGRLATIDIDGSATSSEPLDSATTVRALAMTRTKALTDVLDDLARFEFNVETYYSDLEPQMYIDIGLESKINSLRLFCQTLGWSDLVAALRELIPLRGRAVPSLSTLQEFFIPEVRSRLAATDIDSSKTSSEERSSCSPMGNTHTLEDDRPLIDVSATSRGDFLVGGYMTEGIAKGAMKYPVSFPIKFRAAMNAALAEARRHFLEKASQLPKPRKFGVREALEQLLKERVKADNAAFGKLACKAVEEGLLSPDQAGPAMEEFLKTTAKEAYYDADDLYDDTFYYSFPDLEREITTSEAWLGCLEYFANGTQLERGSENPVSAPAERVSGVSQPTAAKSPEVAVSLALTEPKTTSRRRKATEHTDEQIAYADSRVNSQTEVTTQTAAVWLGYSDSTVRRLIRQGKLTALKTRPKRIATASLKAYRLSLEGPKSPGQQTSPPQT